MRSAREKAVWEEMKWLAYSKEEERKKRSLALERS